MQEKNKEQKIKIAFIKYCGLSSGGTEKFLQTIAANLDKKRFEVDYYYTESVPLIGAEHRHAGTNTERKQYLENHGVNLIEIKLDAVDLTKRNYPWVNTDFFEKFDESKYDLIQTGRGGYPEFPFTKIRKTPIIDSLHLLAGVDNQYNIARVMHITAWSRKIWERKGGDPTRSVVVSHPMQIENAPDGDLRARLNLEGKIILGFHQRNDEHIFSPIPLAAYKEVEDEHTHFLLLGGSHKHRDQAKDLAIKSITFLDTTHNPEEIYLFLKTLDIYAHGRADGEVNSTAMAEAMYFGCPILSHTSQVHNGHVECIGNAGFVAKDLEEYKKIMLEMVHNTKYRKLLSDNALRRFAEKYELRKQMKNIVAIYDDVLRNPFPHSLRRLLSTLKLRRIFIYLPAKVTELLIKNIHRNLKRI